MPDSAFARDDDHLLRHWTARDEAPVVIGSTAHLDLFCTMLRETHHPYAPAAIAWPALDAAEQARLAALPIWDIAVQTEGRASIRVRTFAESATNPTLRAALMLDAEEEARHKVVLSSLVAAYGIPLAPEPAYPRPRHAEWAWLVTGYSECIDSFFAFGLFALAGRSGYFTRALVNAFEPIIQEEARHILFFANWIAWHRRNLAWWRRVVFECRVAAVWCYLLWERIGIARGIDSEGVAHDANFALSGNASIGIEVSPREFLETCRAENARRMAGYDERLLRPKLMPTIVGCIRRFL